MIWATSASAEQEAVKAVVVAYGEGKIELPEPKSAASGGRIWYAPSFAQGDLEAPRDRPYTPQTISDFMGWSTDKVRDSLGALELIESKMLRLIFAKGSAEWEERQAGRKKKADSKRSSTQKGKPKRKAERPVSTDTAGPESGERARVQLASESGTSPATAAWVLALDAKAPDLLEKVASGEMKIRAERRAGEILTKVERTKPEERNSKLQSRKGSSPQAEENSPTYSETIEEAGINRNTAQRWQLEASLPEPAERP